MNIHKNIIIWSATLLIVTPLTVFAVSDLVPLVGVPGLNVNATGIESYIQALYELSITVAALLVVVRIIMGGVKYMLSDIVTSKENAKKEIQGALLGLLVILSAVLILDTINPELKNFSILRNAQPLGVDARSSQIQNQLRTNNPNVQSSRTFEKFGTKEHLNYLTSCRNSGGNPVSSTHTSKTIECRTQ